ncbi:MAG: LPS-assembly protein LptD, partial [Breznakibacter sp.]|nr:LPS-assembly protein LptD [Breznakibacter sp.]
MAPIKGSKPFLEAQIQYKANDSLAFDFEGQKMYLYGKAEIKYLDIELSAHAIELDLDSTLAIAYGRVDTAGVEQDLPVFKDKSGSYTMRRMKYNFETKKAIIEHIVTEQGEGFVIAQKAKRVNETEYFMRDAKYTTCDHHDHPHFYLNLTKAKVIPGKKTITGPAYLVVEDVKLPIFVPFALIPNTTSYSSGIVMPSYGDEGERGFFLREGGYYFAMNDYFDLRLTGDIYTNGSWGTHFGTTYKNRYKYSGRLSADYITNVVSEKDLPDYSKNKDFSIRWSHTQDAKANPYQTFSASVNFATSSYDRNNVGSIINPIDLSTNQKSSSISYSKRWPGSPFNFSANLLHSQNSRDTSISLTIPDITLTMNRVFPFKRKEQIGEERWYEKVSFSYSGNTKNFINTKEKELSFSGKS